MSDFTITAMSIIDSEAGPSGYRVLASYDLTVNGIMMAGCVLVEGPDSLVSAKGVRGKTPKGDKISAQFTDPALQRAITQRTAETYTALTGRRVEVG